MIWKQVFGFPRVYSPNVSLSLENPLPRNARATIADILRADSCGFSEAASERQPLTERQRKSPHTIAFRVSPNPFPIGDRL